MVGRQLPVKRVVRKLRKPFPATLQREQGRQGDGTCGSAATARLRVPTVGQEAPPTLLRSCCWFWRKGERFSHVGVGKREAGLAMSFYGSALGGDRSRSCIMHQEGGALSKEVPELASPSPYTTGTLKRFPPRRGCLVLDPSQGL